MACFIIGAGDFFGFILRPTDKDLVIAADGGWKACLDSDIVPDILLGDFDSIDAMPDFPKVIRHPIEKDDTDTMLAVKYGFEHGETEFHIYGGMGGARTDHTIANIQTLIYISENGGRGWLYGNGEVYTAIKNEEIVLDPVDNGTVSVFCFGQDATGVFITGGKYVVENVTLSASFPLGVSNHFVGDPLHIKVKNGCLVIGINNR